MNDKHRKWTGRTSLSLAVAAIGVVLLVVGAVTMISHNTAAPTDAGAIPTTITTADTAAHPMALAATVTTTAAPPNLSSSPFEATRRLWTAGPSAAAPSRKVPRTATPMRVATGPPTALHLLALGVTAAVEPVDSVHGILQVPDNIAHVGWWRRSAIPGAVTGSTVIDGHIDSAAAGAGALFHLAELSPGATITVSTTTGTQITYRVQARRVYAKAKGLPADLFAQTGPPRLIIISCGGIFDAADRSYQSNIVIYATTQIT